MEKDFEKSLNMDCLFDFHPILAIFYVHFKRGVDCATAGTDVSGLVSAVCDAYFAEKDV